MKIQNSGLKIRSKNESIPTITYQSIAEWQYHHNNDFALQLLIAIIASNALSIALSIWVYPRKTTNKESKSEQQSETKQVTYI